MQLHQDPLPATYIYKYMYTPGVTLTRLIRLWLGVRGTYSIFSRRLGVTVTTSHEIWWCETWSDSTSTVHKSHSDTDSCTAVPVDNTLTTATLYAHKIECTLTRQQHTALCHGFNPWIRRCGATRAEASQLPTPLVDCSKSSRKAASELRATTLRATEV